MVGAGVILVDWTPMTTKDAARKTTPLGLAWRIYQHVAAVIGCFALLAFLGNFVDLDWRSLLSTVIGAWDEHVRPPVRALFHAVVTVPMGWFGWQVEVPQWLCDYFATGVVLATSAVRTWGSEDGLRASLRDAFVVNEGLDLITFWAPGVVLLWPISFLAYAFEGLLGAFARDRNALPYLMVIAPVMYAGGLLAVNYLLPR